ncbi:MULTISPECIES: ABC transporter permease [Bifidobacterium]|uniref:ABC transporter permease n=1 Tax=Bifidobacterium tibiigranuli TaxID=2172043 RepID=A0A5N6S9P9_9BIFI|nr:ABC transporter permease [Bifidobacterium tibiigranuli]KAE8130259.1 ABC transporter permease [Bifidobacterium tibiigranuli]KAE8130381.1 ABC transporter permease [Bifidobacterium tibiigranuli]
MEISMTQGSVALSSATPIPAKPTHAQLKHNQLKHTAQPPAAQPGATIRGSGTARKMLTIIGAFLPVIIIVAICLFAPALSHFSPTTTVGAARLSPNAKFWFGTDSVGMDVYSRTLYGTRIAIQFAIVVAVLSTVLGVLIGTFIGLTESSKGVISNVGRVLNKISEYIIAIPGIILAIVVVGLMGSSNFALITSLTLVLVQAPIKLTRVEILQVKRENYLEAAQMAGESSFESAFVHVIPNSIGPALRNLPLIFGNCVINLAALGFIGIGVNAPTPEWGYMISKGISSMMLGRWWEAVFPSLFLFASVLGISYSSKAIPKAIPLIRQLAGRRGNQ